MENGLYGRDEEIRLDVARFLAQVERARHAEVVVQFSRGVRVDRERARGCLGVHLDQVWAAAADNGYEGRLGECEERFGGYGCGELAEVFLAVLESEC